MTTRRHSIADVDSAGGRGLPAEAPACPVDRLPTVRRNRLCLRIIYIGLLNFLLYTVGYAVLGGDAHNGERRMIDSPTGPRAAYFVRGHFIRDPNGQEREVRPGLWVYSYLHSISVFVTSAAMLVSMLVLARPHILATMRDGWVRGQTFVVVFGTVVVLVTAAAVAVFTWDFLAQITSP
ncbi:MAG: hypothetical protein HZB38_13650 [Planctomycetes bacterium]|nr:hypothetical protein [Planctomycetota bacterium]